MTADAGLIARLRDEIDSAADPDACTCAGQHLIRCHLGGTLTEAEHEVLYARLIQRRRAVAGLIEVLSPADAVETALQLAGHGEPAVPAEVSRG